LNVIKDAFRVYIKYCNFDTDADTLLKPKQATKMHEYDKLNSTMTIAYNKKKN